MNWKILFAIIGIMFGIFLSGCVYKNADSANGTDGNIPVISTPTLNNSNTNASKLDLRLFAKIEKTNFSKGEDIRVNVTLINNGYDTIYLENNNSRNFDIMFYFSNSTKPIVIRDNSLKNITLAPGKYFSESITWNQTFNINGAEGRLRAGKYRVIVYLASSVILKNQNKVRPYTLKTNPLIINIYEQENKG